VYDKHYSAKKGAIVLQLNLYASKKEIRLPLEGYSIIFESLPKENARGNRGLLQSIVNTLCRRGFDAAVVPYHRAGEFDIAVLGKNTDRVHQVMKSYSNLKPKVEKRVFDRVILSVAWANRLRVHLLQRGFMKSGVKYFHKRALTTKDNFKEAFRIQADIIKGIPSLWVDPSTRIVTPLTDEDIAQALKLGEDSHVGVRVLPNWSYGVLVGKVGKKAKEMSFSTGGKQHSVPDYWRVKHGIDFVNKEDEMLEIVMPPYMRKFHYPRTCVFKEYPRGMWLPSRLRRGPSQRVKEASDFVKSSINGVSFLGSSLDFDGPSEPSKAGFRVAHYGKKTELLVANQVTSSIDDIYRNLRTHGPYTGPISGKYFIIHPGQKAEVLKGVEGIQRTYSSLNLGKIEPMVDVGDHGLLDAQGASVTDYTSAITSLRMGLDSDKRAIGLIVLPDPHASEVYFRSRGQLFERLYGMPPFPAQAIAMDSIREIDNKGRRSMPICVNTSAQIYIKFGGTGTALWILKRAADSQIPGITPGSSCYAYHDVSRRYEIKSSATAYSALTDSFGRYIATGTKPIGGERLTENNFYDILVELIQKISIFSQRYKKVDQNRSFDFKRLVFAKDGVIRSGEANMMADVIMNGIPDQRKEPIAKLLEKTDILPKKLVIDIIGVNKSPNKRIFDYSDNGHSNVKVGTVVIYSDDNGLLVSSSTHSGTSQPLEITLHKHLCINQEELPRPHISDIMNEYYRLTFLNWSSLFKKGKYALPQILTQNLGENLTKGIIVPDDMVLL